MTTSLTVKKLPPLHYSYYYYCCCYNHDYYHYYYYCIPITSLLRVKAKTRDRMEYYLHTPSSLEGVVVTDWFPSVTNLTENLSGVLVLRSVRVQSELKISCTSTVIAELAYSKITCSELVVSEEVM